MPFKFKVKAPPPALALVGAIDETVGGGLVTAKFTAADVPPPGAGFVTVIGKLPIALMSEARIEAVI